MQFIILMILYNCQSATIIFSIQPPDVSVNANAKGSAGLFPVYLLYYGPGLFKPSRTRLCRLMVY